MDSGWHRQGRWGLAAGVALLALGLFWALRESVVHPPAFPSADDGAAPDDPAAPRVTILPVATQLSPGLLSKDGPVEDELGAVAQLLYAYRQGFGENPVGDNGDIVTTLLGENEKRAAYLTRDCPALVDGKLVDRWGTPYWFHALSGTEMEIVSAGPDRELFTGDDLRLP